MRIINHGQFYNRVWCCEHLISVLGYTDDNQCCVFQLNKISHSFSFIPKINTYADDIRWNAEIFPHVFESVVCYIRNVRSQGTLMVMIIAEADQQQPWERLLTHVNLCVWRQQGYSADKVIFIQCYSLVLISSWTQKCRRRVLSPSSCALSNLPSARLLALDTIKDIQDTNNTQGMHLLSTILLKTVHIQTHQFHILSTKHSFQWCRRLTEIMCCFSL